MEGPSGVLRRVLMTACRGGDYPRPGKKRLQDTRAMPSVHAGLRKCLPYPPDS